MDVRISVIWNDGEKVAIIEYNEERWIVWNGERTGGVEFTDVTQAMEYCEQQHILVTKDVFGFCPECDKWCEKCSCEEE